MLLNGCAYGTCTVVWLRVISRGIQKCHMQTHLYVIVIKNKRQGHLFQNMEGSSCVDNNNNNNK